MLQGSVIIPSDFCRLHPLQNTQINQERQTGYRVISYPCCNGRLCQKYTVTDAHKQILIISPEGSNYSPKPIPTKTKSGGHDVCWCDSPPVQISHTSSQHLTGSLFIKSRWVSCWVWVVAVAWQYRLGSSGAWFGSTFTHSNCCFCPYKQRHCLDNDGDETDFISSETAFLWNANDKENTEIRTLGDCNQARADGRGKGCGVL